MLNLSDLNPQQYQAVRAITRPCLVLAGAGSGKTRVITQKIAYLMVEQGYDPRQVLALTFTNKAAKEMQERVVQQLKKVDYAVKPNHLQLSTFHAFGVRFLRSHHKDFQLRENFTLLNAHDTYQRVAELISTTSKDEVRAYCARLSHLKNQGISPDQALSQAQTPLDVQCARLFQRYQETLESWQAVDFDDLILKPLSLLESSSEIQTLWQQKIRYILIDEYQDTNVMQYRLLKALVGARGSFTAVGDDDQSIYAWRGASLENIKDLQSDFPTLEVIKLEQNYRSTNRILQAANTLIANNPKLFDKKLWSAWGLGDPISLVAAENEEQEAVRVCTAISQQRFQRGGRFGDYAILYRGNHQARLFEEMLRKENIPYTVSGGQSFFERSEIKDISAYLRLMVNDDDDAALMRALNIPRRGLGTSTLKGLGYWAQFRNVSLFEALFEEGVKQHIPERSHEELLSFGHLINQLAQRGKSEPAHEVLNDLLEHISYKAWLFDQYEEKDAEQRWENVQHFCTWVTKKAQEDGKTLVDIAQTIQLISILTEDEENPDAVKLSTLHAAKGLEFKHVFLVGVEEGILPHVSGDEELTTEKLFEERRLMYVGVTRARESLTISWCKKRKRAKDAKICQPSRFIEELGLDEYKKQEQAEFLKLDSKSRFAQLKALLGASPEPTKEG